MIVIVGVADGLGVNVGMSVLVLVGFLLGEGVLVADGVLVGDMYCVSVGKGRSVASCCIAGEVHAEIIARTRIKRQAFITGFDENENTSPPGVIYRGPA